MPEKNAIITKFADKAAAEAARRRLLKDGIPADQIVLIGKDYPPREKGRDFERLVRSGAYVVIQYGSPNERPLRN